MANQVFHLSYLYGQHFTFLTYHKPLQYLDNIKEDNAKLERWKLTLSEYDFEISHIKGKENNLADAISRIK